MALIKYKLGLLIELVLDTNSELLFTADDVRGMTITKEIIPTKANVLETDLSKFLIVNPNEFIYNPRTHGKKKVLVITIHVNLSSLVGTILHFE